MLLLSAVLVSVTTISGISTVIMSSRISSAIIINKHSDLAGVVRLAFRAPLLLREARSLHRFALDQRNLLHALARSVMSRVRECARARHGVTTS